ncbi:MAG: BON domain-containing protein [Desulfovibrio sp.]|jgi:osmotically-inducible protein OsmY|nr:BON domain-containing protein [Desulfovibrio sp.]
MCRQNLLCCILLICGFFPAGCAVVSGIPAHVPRLESRYDDAGIKTEVAGALLALDPSKANDINVHCFFGNVFLIGEADREFRREAVDAAEKISGVTRVTTHWFPSGSAATHEDAAIEAKLSEVLPASAKDAGGRVDADVWGGHVVLTGMVRRQSDIDLAVQAAKRVEKVRSVTSYLITDAASKR